MKKCYKYVSFVLILCTLLVIPLQTNAAEKISVNKATCDLKMGLQRLWIDHVTWTRSYIVSDLASLEDKDAVLERLLRNQDDIGNAIKPYYGKKVAEKLSELLREHIVLAGQVLDAAKKGDQDNLKKYNTLWHQNADDIAKFLSSANPNYSEKTLKDMLYKHLQLITEQAVARLNKNWKADIKAYDEGETHMIHFAEYLADGIIKQFPNKFK